MSKSKFFLLLGISLIVTISLMYTLSFNEKMLPYLDVGYYAIPAFTVLSLIVYFLTDYLERTPKRKILFNLVIINVMLKMFISVLVIVLYYNITKPKDGIFVVPFIIVYVVFTIFETYFMSEQARHSKYK